MGISKAVVITGTSSGIGKACALYLDEMGYKVYAGVRKQVDGDNLKKESSGRLTPVILDVCNAESISTAVSIIKKETGGNVFGLINNAGIGQGGPLEITPLSEIRKVMEINVIGLMAVTQAFLPMLRKSKGRIINIGSSTSIIAFPGASVYAASKFAVRALTDSLRVELKLFDMYAVLVVPGHVETVMWNKEEKYKDTLHKTIDSEIAQEYAPLIKFGDKLTAEMARIPANEVAKVIATSLTTKKPKPYYYVGKDSKGISLVVKFPKCFLDWMFYKRIKKMK